MGSTNRIVVARHVIDGVSAREIADDLTTRSLPQYLLRVTRPTGRVVARPDVALDVFASLARTVAGFRSANDPKFDLLDTWKAAVLILQASIGVLQVGSRDDGEVELKVGVDPLNTVVANAVGVTGTGTAGKWLRAAMWAVIAHDVERCNFLMGVPAGRLRLSPVKSEEYVYVLVELVQEYLCRGTEVAALRARLEDAMRPGVVRADARPLLDHVDRPFIGVLDALIAQDEGAFNRSMEAALVSHRKYWSSKSRCKLPEGYISEYLTALATLARDAGMDLTVTSDYLPENLVLGEWVGEFDT